MRERKRPVHLAGAQGFLGLNGMTRVRVMKDAFGPNLNHDAGEANRSEDNPGAVMRVNQYRYDAVGR